MSVHSVKAKELFEKGYNCSQSVVLAFCDIMQLDEKVALKIASSFGGGIGRLREMCGAVSGMAIVVGYLMGYDNPEDDLGKANHYERIQKLAFKFKEENGTYICRDLLGLDKDKKESHIPEKRTSDYYKRRPCGELVACAAEILDEYLENNMQ